MHKECSVCLLLLIFHLTTYRLGRRKDSLCIRNMVLALAGRPGPESQLVTAGEMIVVQSRWRLNEFRRRLAQAIQYSALMDYILSVHFATSKIVRPLPLSSGGPR